MGGGAVLWHEKQYGVVVRIWVRNYSDLGIKSQGYGLPFPVTLTILFILFEFQVPHLPNGNNNGLYILRIVSVVLSNHFDVLFFLEEEI